MTRQKILVTGGSGFLAAHCIVRLLADGREVRTTVREPLRSTKVVEMLRIGGVRAADIEANVSFVAADLTSDDGWAAAVSGCDGVLHVASPYPATAPAHEDDLIIPARDGALRVLRAARAAEVRRVVMTSSFAAIGYGHEPTTRPYDESSWTDVRARAVTAYARSKTLAERAAWDFVEEEGAGLELSVVNPTGILGPVLGTDVGTSIGPIAQMLSGRLPAVPRMSVGVVDVRDVADLHVRALSAPAASGERFIATAGTTTLAEMAGALREALGAAASHVPTRTIPDWVVRIAAVFDDNARQSLPMLGAPHQATSAKAQERLGWAPRPVRQAVVDAGESVIRRGLAGSPV